MFVSAGDIEGVIDLRPEGLDAAGVEDMVKEYFTKADQVCAESSWLISIDASISHSLVQAKWYGQLAWHQHIGVY